ncbi:MAG: serine--tRNA ligase, partial [Candidatus Omnitrophica bacterium]|nr:serine--tRNA ligase [Candidatus Omnitrophota bacterium]
MLDAKFVRENIDTVKKALVNRNSKLDMNKFALVDKRRREIIAEVEELKGAKNEASKKIGMLIKEKKDAEGAKKEVNEITEKIKVLDETLKGIETEYKNFLLSIPNVPHESVPVGKGEEDNVEVRRHGKIKDYSFKPKDHVELGVLNGILDFERAAKISGSGFPMFTGDGARLERSLINFMLDVHTKEHGYKEIFPPFLVNRETMTGTGQLPKMEDDMYKIDGEDMFLIPTAEVPVTNYHAGETIPEENLPIRYTANTPCLRKEAGSYGKETKGIIRVHQFDKVEMVKFTRPQDSMNELESLVNDAEDILKRLGLPYRVLELCTADISFAAAKCYDIELWAPGSDRWLEVSSCSVFGDFQARRANIKYKPKDTDKKTEFLHTLNGSGVALARLFVAIIETYQRQDGSIEIPEPLVPYFGSK